MKKILIAGYPDLTKNYENALACLGAECTTSLHVPDIFCYDGLILPGGGDIDPKLFGQLNQGSRKIDPMLDRLQMAILHEFVIYQKPILGICKGMQLINIFFGGDIYQHLSAYKSHQYEEKDQIHETYAKEDSLLYHLYGERFTVNSAHHQGVHSPGRNIQYIQHCPDGVVEGLSHAYLPVVGVQWHPERMCFSNKREDTADGSLLLASFLNYFHQV